MALKIKVLKKPTKVGNCGGVEYQVRWILDPADTGYVIQRVNFGHEVLKCDGTADPDLTGAKSCSGSDAPTYFEAWRVENGKVFIGTGKKPHNADTYRILDHPSRKKRHEILGKVQFIAGYKLTLGNGADDWQEPGVKLAGVLPTRATAPAEFDADAARDHNLSVEWDCCGAKPREPRIEGGPTTSDDDTKEKVTNTVPIEVSPGAKRATRLIESFPTWMEANASQQAKTALMTRLKRIDALHSDVIRGGIELYIDQSKRAKSYSVDEESRLYLLNRYLFKLPRLVPVGEFPFFGGWDIPVDGERFNPSWPFVVKPSGLVLEGAFSGYYGDEYMALDEFDYFRQMYRRRKPPTS